MKATLMLMMMVLGAVAVTAQDPALAETAAVAHIPVEAELASDVALDNEVDVALHHSDEAPITADQDFASMDAEMGVPDGMSLDSNTDLSVPAVDTFDAVDAVAEASEEEDAIMLGESESVSVAVTESETDASAEEAESASAAVDSDEDASFLEVNAEDEDEAEDESEDEEEAEDESEEEAEDEDEDEAEEEESEDEADTQEALQTALIEQIVEADADEDSEAEAAEHEASMTAQGIELVADAESAHATAEADTTKAAGVTTAEESHEHDTAAAEMVDVSDFDVAKLKAAETENVRTAGRVTAGLSDATIEAKGVAAETEPVNANELVAVVSDKDVRKAAGAVSLVETDAAGSVNAEQHVYAQTQEQRNAEQQKLDLMHSVLVALRTEQGRPVDEELTPADMDEIEERMAVMVEVTATAVADADVNAKAETEAEHPRDHIHVARIAPEVQPTTPGASLTPAKIVGERRHHRHHHHHRHHRSPYRFDVHYRPDRREFLSQHHVELVDHAHHLHRRDPTKPSKLKNPVKPGVWDKRSPWATRPKQAYRYDVQYERRSSCCRRREACCIRGVKGKTVPKRVLKPAKVIDPEAEHRKRVEARRKREAERRKKHSFARVEYEAERGKCCAAKSACCAPPQKMYDADVQYLPGGEAADYVVVASSGERALVIDAADGGEYTPVGNVDELSILERIQSRQALLHKLLLSHESPFYYDDHFNTPVSDEHIVLFHEPAAARDPEQLTLAEEHELREWMAKLPVVPALAVVETTAAAHAASGDVFLQTASESETEADSEAYTFRPEMKPARVLKGFVDVEQEPTTLSQLLSDLPPAPAAAEEQRDDAAEALAEAEADYNEDI